MRIYGLLVLLCGVLLFAARDARTQGDIPCYERSTVLVLFEPWMQSGLACLEGVIDDASLGELAFTALATAPDGTLYAARPLAGEIWALTDSNGDDLPDEPARVVGGLILPNGLDYHDDALYISGGSHVYRWRNGELETLVDDLPSGGGFWTGGIAVTGDRFYVATGAPCDHCQPDDPERGAVLSYTLEGDDRQIAATGLRSPADLAVVGGDLWVVDSAPDALFDTPDLDEINRVRLGAAEPLHFGFPYCAGQIALDSARFECAAAVDPAVALPTASTPVSIAAYRGDAIPQLAGQVLVVLRGSYNELELRGYSVVTVDRATGEVAPFIPARPDDSPSSDFTVEEMSFRGSGFFPARPLGVTVTEAGWIYVSVGGGRILALRP